MHASKCVFLCIYAYMCVFCARPWAFLYAQVCVRVFSSHCLPGHGPTGPRGVLVPVPPTLSPAVPSRSGSAPGTEPRGRQGGGLTALALSLLGQAKLGDEILDYRDLAALPKSKAIYDIDRPDMISYTPYVSHSVGDRQSCSEVPPPSRPLLLWAPFLSLGAKRG